MRLCLFNEVVFERKMQASTIVCPRRNLRTGGAKRRLTPSCSHDEEETMEAEDDEKRNELEPEDIISQEHKNKKRRRVSPNVRPMRKTRKFSPAYGLCDSDPDEDEDWQPLGTDNEECWEEKE
mmetsp:Transcript_12856/g.19263  ORF Transcript_12856/g.19263 Transcript_12856/m.19263 type:complete len:123 (+) Transcript_12856:1534-1902(+)